MENSKRPRVSVHAIAVHADDDTEVARRSMHCERGAAHVEGPEAHHVDVVLVDLDAAATRT